MLNRFEIRQSSNVILALAADDGITLKQVYKIKNYTSLILEDYGHLREEHFEDRRSSRFRSRRRLNFQGVELVGSVTFMTNESYKYFYSRRHQEFDTSTRGNFLQLDPLMDLMNGSKKFIFTPRFGYDETGIWVGNAGNMIYEHADIPIAPFFLTKERLHYLDFVGTITATKMVFIFRAPPLSSVANLYTLPFSKGVWISFGVLLSILIVAVFVLLRYQQHNATSKHDRRPTAALTDVVLMGVAVVCQMGSTIEARMSASRIITFFFLLSSVFFYTSFTASIVGILQSTTRSIQTLTDLYTSKLELGATDTQYNRHYMGVNAIHRF